MILILALMAALAALALLTQAGIRLIEARHPPSGRFIPVSSGRIHVLDIPARDPSADALPVVLLHGASGNLEEMRNALEQALGERRRLIFLDRPGLGWSTRGALRADAPPERQAALLGEALDAIGVQRAVFVAYSFGGAVGAAFALCDPKRVAGLVLLAPPTHRWEGGLSWYNMFSTSVFGRLFAHTLVVPLGALLLPGEARAVFLPQRMPEAYVKRSAIALLLRPQNFLANAWDIAQLKDALATMETRYPRIAAPTVIITGDTDNTVSPDLHSRALHALVPGSELVVLPGMGHMLHFFAPGLIAAKVEAVAKHAEAKAPARVAQKAQATS